MKVVHIAEAENYEPEKDWKRISLCGECDISVEHFVKPPGHASPDHSHPNSQVLVVLEGKLVITTEKDGEQELGVDELFYLPVDCGCSLYLGARAHFKTAPLHADLSGDPRCLA